MIAIAVIKFCNCNSEKANWHVTQVANCPFTYLQRPTTKIPTLECKSNVDVKMDPDYPNGILIHILWMQVGSTKYYFLCVDI